MKLWPIVNHKEHKIEIKTAISTISAHAKSINAVRTSLNEDFIASCSHDRTVKIWNYLEHTLECSKEFEEPAHALAFHPSGLNLVNILI